jgi:hypothetical protein
MPRHLTRRESVAIIGSVAVAAIVIFVGFGPAGLLVTGTVCRLGSAVGSYTIYAPEALVNKPDSTNVSIDIAVVNYTFFSGPVSMGELTTNSRTSAANFGGFDSLGGILGGFIDVNFTFYQTKNDSELGAVSNPCTQPYVASAEPYTGCGGSFTVPMADSVNDENQPHVWNQSSAPCGTTSPGAYVWFDSTYHAGRTNEQAPVTLDLCDSTGEYPLVLSGVARVPVNVTVPYRGSYISSHGFLTWVGQPNPPPPVSGTLSPATAYWFLSSGWNWSLAPVGPASAPIDPALPLPGLLAFQRSAC